MSEKAEKPNLAPDELYIASMNQLESALTTAYQARFHVIDITSAMQDRANDILVHGPNITDRTQFPDDYIDKGSNEAARKARANEVLAMDLPTIKFAEELRAWDERAKDAEVKAVIAKERCRLARLLLAQQIGVTIGDL